MCDETVLEKVRELRARRYTPAEIARALAISKSEAEQLVRAVAAEQGTSAPGRGGDQVQCWVSPGWSHKLTIDGYCHWPCGDGSENEATDSGVALVMTAAPDGHGRVQMCTFLVDTWCLGVKNAMGPVRMRTHELVTIRRQCFGAWRSQGIAAPLELGQHLVLGAVEFARTLGFEPHPDFKRARPALGDWDGPSAITFGMSGTPHYINGPYDDPQRVLSTLERTVGRDGFHYTVSLGEADDLGDGYTYSATITDLDEGLDLSDAA